MKVMFFAPVEVGAGEIITALHMGEIVAGRGHEVLYLIPEFGRKYSAPKSAADFRHFTDDGALNRSIWDGALSDFQPDIVVFADYQYMSYKTGIIQFSDKQGWVRSLDEVNACLVTLDHMGLAQGPMGFFFGPPHLGLNYISFGAIPEHMRIMLPCPMHEPEPVTGRKGVPFRYWDVPMILPEAERREVRLNYIQDEDDYLIFHPVPKWALRLTKAQGFPYYDFLPDILEYYLCDLPRPVTVVSLNNGNLLRQSRVKSVDFVNVPNLEKSEYEKLLFSSDLMITENNSSISMGKAICGLTPCAVLHNSYRYLELTRRLKGQLLDVVNAMERRWLGSVYPYNSLMSGTDEIDQLGFYRDNTITRAFRELEVYGDQKTRQELRLLLTDEATRSALRRRQIAYVNKVRTLHDAEQVLSHLYQEWSTN